MARFHFSSKKSGGAAVRTRPVLLRPLWVGLIGAVALAVVLILVIRSARSRNAAPKTEPAPAVAAETVPAPAPAEPDSELPPAMQMVPADTSAELALRAAEKRDGFPMLRWDVERFTTGSDGRMTYTGGERALTGVDVSLVNGGQPVYYYMISAE